MNCQFDKIVEKNYVSRDFIRTQWIWRNGKAKRISHKARTRAQREKDELENVIAAKIEIETMSTENESTINGLWAPNERDTTKKNEIVFRTYTPTHSNC